MFDQKIEGFQSNTFIGTGFILANAGSQSTKGYEFDLVMSPTDYIDLAISGLFMDPIYDSFPNSSSGDLTGTMPSNISENTISSTITWNLNFNNWDGYLRLSHLYASEAEIRYLSLLIFLPHIVIDKLSFSIPAEKFIVS